MEIETRKVQKLGYSSLGISLPKPWALAAGLKPGGLVSLYIEDDGTLRLKPGPHDDKPPPSECTIDADACETPQALTRVITGAYIVGRNTIRVRSRDELSASQLQEIHGAVQRLTGLTIVNQGPKFVTIENFAEPTRFPIDGLLRRLHYLTSRMARLALGRLTGQAQEDVREVSRMEAEVDRLYWLVVRQLLLAAKDRSVAATIGETEPRHVVGDRVVAAMLENIGDMWEEVGEGLALLLEQDRDLVRHFGEGVAPVKDLLDDLIETTMNAFFAGDLGLANDALDMQGELASKLGVLVGQVPSFRCTPGEDFCATCTLLRSILRPVEHISKLYATIAQLTINRIMETTTRPFGR
jgi:phosphate uptake regulator